MNATTFVFWLAHIYSEIVAVRIREGHDLARNVDLSIARCCAHSRGFGAAIGDAGAVRNRDAREPLLYSVDANAGVWRPACGPVASGTLCRNAPS